MLTRSTDSMLRSLGFETVALGYRRGDWLLQLRSDWGRLSRPWSQGQDPSQLPGLWKRVDGLDGPVQSFDWPGDACIAEETEDARLEGCSLEEMLTWAWASAEGKFPDGWQAPGRAEVESWCPRADYTIGTGHLLRQIDLRCAADELSLETPVLLSCPAELPASRRCWLAHVALQTQSHWPLVRLRFEESTGALKAEVDLRGAPRRAAHCLISVGLASLRGAVAGLAEAAELLADTAVVSEALCIPHLTRTTT